MPAEAIHLSALDDSLSRSLARPLLSPPARREAARLGAILVDLPYFDRFPLAVARYLFKRPVVASRWGDILHRERPAEIGKRLVLSAALLRAHRSTREEGEALLALALGYCSHLAVDAAIHPSVNRLAKARAARLGDSAERQHSEVEKFQSILYHEARLGFDFMGRPEVRAYIAVDAAPLYASLAGQRVRDALVAALRRAPGEAELRRFRRGYLQYGALISTALGKTIMPAAVKDEVREEVFEGASFRFMARYEAAVERSRRHIDAALALAESPGDEAAFDGEIPEGSIDDPPYPTE